MPIPALFAGAYLAINVPLMVWLVRAQTEGRTPPSAITISARVVRYGPAFLGFVYLVTIAGDWPFVLFVLTFFVASFWMLGRALNFPSEPPRRRGRP